MPTVEQICAAFSAFDANREGKIFIHDVDYVLRGLGYGDLAKQHVAGMIRSNEKVCEEGKISMDAFLSIVQHQGLARGHSEEIWVVFKQLDKHHKGRITFEDFLSAARQELNPITSRNVQQLLNLAAEHPDKGISFDEWRMVQISVLDERRKRQNMTSVMSQSDLRSVFSRKRSVSY